MARECPAVLVDGKGVGLDTDGKVRRRGPPAESMPTSRWSEISDLEKTAQTCGRKSD